MSSAVLTVYIPARRWHSLTQDFFSGICSKNGNQNKTVVIPKHTQLINEAKSPAISCNKRQTETWLFQSW